MVLLSSRPSVSQTTPLALSDDGTDKYLEHIVPYVPTPMDIAQKMLELAKVRSDDVVYDLGSGDGRIVILAAQKFGARAVGVELNSDLYEESSKRVRDLGLEHRVEIMHENMFDVNIRHATVVTLYLLTKVNERLRPEARAATPFRHPHRLPRISSPRLAARPNSASHVQRRGALQASALRETVRGPGNRVIGRWRNRVIG